MVPSSAPGPAPLHGGSPGRVISAPWCKRRCALPQFIPSPSISGFHVGPLMVHFYALGYIIGITFAVLITRRRWRASAATRRSSTTSRCGWCPPGSSAAGSTLTSRRPNDIPHVWYGPFAVWTGGLGIWGGVAVATRQWARGGCGGMGLSVGPFANAIAPALLVAQAIGRIGNYTNKELFGEPTTLPWALEVPPRVPSRGLPAVRHVPADVPVRADLGPRAGRLPGLARPSREDQVLGPVRALRRRLLRVPDRRGVGPDRLLRALPRPAAEHVHRDRRHASPG